jgi:hypothetical protein
MLSVYYRIPTFLNSEDYHDEDVEYFVMDWMSVMKNTGLIEETYDWQWVTLGESGVYGLDLKLYAPSQVVDDPDFREYCDSVWATILLASNQDQIHTLQIYTETFYKEHSCGKFITLRMQDGYLNNPRISRTLQYIGAE